MLTFTRFIGMPTEGFENEILALYGDWSLVRRKALIMEKEATILGSRFKRELHKL